jgi:hypothetical protein
LLNQRGSADGPFAANLAALHAAGKFNLLGAREQRNRADFAQVTPYRIVAIREGRGGFLEGRGLLETHSIIVQ